MYIKQGMKHIQYENKETKNAIMYICNLSIHEKQKQFNIEYIYNQ